MAKRIIDWTEDKGVLSLNRYNSDKEAKPETLHLFDLNKIFPDFGKMNKVQKYVVIYGAKQKLADVGSSEKTAEGRAEKAKTQWDLFIKGEVAGPRANATGNAENKRLADTVKTASKVVSLEGLMMKKMAFPDTFTPEDQKKLDEFLAKVAKSKSKK